MVVYELKCRVSGKSYIGKTQDYLKKRTQQHAETCGRLLSQEEPNMGKTGLVVGGMGKQMLMLSTLHICVETVAIAIRSRRS